MTTPAAPIIGPHRPCPECPACVETFAGEPPSGVASLREAVERFASIEHCRGYVALRPRQSETHTRPGWVGGR